MVENLLVVKFGGGAGLDVEACARDLAAIAPHPPPPSPSQGRGGEVGRPVIVVHGVSAALDALCAERGVPVRTLTSPSGHTSRYTDAATRDLFVEAAQAVGRQWVEALTWYGVTAEAVAPVVQGVRKDAVRAVIDGRVRVVRDDYTGSILGVDSGPLLDALRRGVVPVVPPLAVSDEGLLNVDGDRAAAAIAVALGAAELVILSNVRGLYRDLNNLESFVPTVAHRNLPQALEWAAGRMKRKVIAVQDALEGGVRRVVIGDGRRADPVRAALGDEGTVFREEHLTTENTESTEKSLRGISSVGSAANARE